MSFDKAAYWKNRKDGVRGQGEQPKVVFVANAKQGEHLVRIGGKLQTVNRRIARSRQKIRLYTKKGFTGHIVNEANADIKLPSFPSDLPNHDRMIIRGETRAVYAEKARELKQKTAA